MSQLPKYNLSGEETGSVEVDAEASANGQLIKDVVVAQRANQRQWSACTKTRKEVNHTGKKPHRQKGQGRARQGSLAAPQYKGGGVVFGPRPKFNQRIRINKKERRQAIRALLAEKAKSENLFVIEEPNLQAPKTQVMAALLKALKIEGRTLVVGNDRMLYKSVRNLPDVEYRTTPSVHDLAVAKNVVVTETALGQLKQ